MKRISFVDFAEKRDDSTMRLIDVREADEFRAVRVKGAELFPLSKIRDGALPDEDERESYIICRSGARSAMAAQIFERAGWNECTNVEGGTLAAIKAGEEYVESDVDS